MNSTPLRPNTQLRSCYISMKARLAVTQSDFNLAYSFRYEAYVNYGDMPANACCMFKDALDEAPHSHLFLLFDSEDESKLIGTARALISDGDYPFISTPLFDSELSPLFACCRMNNMMALEVSRVAISADYRNSTKPIRHILKSIINFGKELGIGYVVAPVRRKQQKAYKNLAAMQEASPERYCPNQKVTLQLMYSPTQLALERAKLTLKLDKLSPH